MLASDEKGRKLEFNNTDIGGGFEAVYTNTGKVRKSHVCFVNGIQCWADEARFGGIVVQFGSDPNKEMRIVRILTRTERKRAKAKSPKQSRS